MLRVYFARSVTKNEVRLKTEYFLKQTIKKHFLLSLSKWGVWLNAECGLKVNNCGICACNSHAYPFGCKTGRTVEPRLSGLIGTSVNSPDNLRVWIIENMSMNITNVNKRYINMRYTEQQRDILILTVKFTQPVGIYSCEQK